MAFAFQIPGKEESVQSLFLDAIMHSFYYQLLLMRRRITYFILSFLCFIQYIWSGYK